MTRGESSNDTNGQPGTCGACRHAKEPDAPVMRGRGFVQCRFVEAWKYPSERASCAARPERYEARA